MSQFLPKGTASVIKGEVKGFLKDTPKNMARAVRHPVTTAKDMKSAIGAIVKDDPQTSMALLNKYAPSSPMVQMLHEQGAGKSASRVDQDQVAITNMSLTNYHPKGLKTPRSTFGNILSQIPVLKHLLGLGQGPKQAPAQNRRMHMGPKNPGSSGPKAPTL